MHKKIVTVDVVTGKVISEKFVGANCVLSDWCFVVGNDAPELIGSLFDLKAKEFRQITQGAFDETAGTFEPDIIGDVIYTIGQGV